MNETTQAAAVGSEPDWSALARPIPTWYTDARFGVFIHYGPYSVPAWAEPLGELGTIDEEAWFARNPYAEWYWNSLRIEGSPTAIRHQRLYGDAPYDDFLDAWHAERFDAQELMALIADAGAGYVVPTTKHHDGIALWDAPGSGTRNTVKRGPRRDFITELAEATSETDVRFGVYYSGGLDWGFATHPPIRNEVDLHRNRPVDDGYAKYAHEQLRDLIDRYRPAVLFNDIDWPDAGKVRGPHGLFELLQHYRKVCPEGVVNDRWGIAFSDVEVSEYQWHGNAESQPVWENTRGIGYSFGYNEAEDASHSLSPAAAVRLLVDTVSRGGNLLLNIGPRADGSLPEVQRQVLVGLATWMADGRSAIRGGGPVSKPDDHRSDEPWIRWLKSPDGLFVVVDEAADPIVVERVPSELDRSALGAQGHDAVELASDGTLRIRSHGRRELPRVIRLPMR